MSKSAMARFLLHLVRTVIIESAAFRDPDTATLIRSYIIPYPKHKDSERSLRLRLSSGVSGQPGLPRFALPAAAASKRKFTGREIVVRDAAQAQAGGHHAC